MGWQGASGEDCRRSDCAAGWRGIPSCLAALPDQIPKDANFVGKPDHFCAQFLLLVC